MGTVSKDGVPWMGRIERVALLESMLTYYFSSRIDINAFKAWFAHEHGGWFDANGNLPCPSFYAYNFSLELEKYFKQEEEQRRIALFEEKTRFEAKAEQQQAALSEERKRIDAAIAELDTIPLQHVR